MLEAGRVGGERVGPQRRAVNNGRRAGFPWRCSRKLGARTARERLSRVAAAVDTRGAIDPRGADRLRFRRCGKLKLAAKPHHYEKLDKTYELIVREVDPDIELIVPRARIRDEVGSDRFYGGLVFARAARCTWASSPLGLADAASRHGARIFENAAVTGSTEWPAAGTHATTARGELRAKQVLIATGTVAAGPFGWYRRRHRAGRLVHRRDRAARREPYSTRIMPTPRAHDDPN